MGINYLSLISIFATLLLCCFVSSCAERENPATKSEPKPGTPQSLDHATVPSLMRMANAALSGGDKVTAVRLYQRVLQRKPFFEEAIVNMVQLMMDEHEYTEAITVLENALQHEAENVPYMVLLGKCYVNKEEPEKAINVFNVVLKQKPTHVLALEGKGIALDFLGKHLEAQKYYQKALEIMPKNPTIQGNMGLSLALSGNYKKAIQILQALVESGEAKPRDIQNLAITYGLNGDMASAAQYLQMCTNSEEEVRNNLAYISYLKKNRSGPAIASIANNWVDDNESEESEPPQKKKPDAHKKAKGEGPPALPPEEDDVYEEDDMYSDEE